MKHSLLVLILLLAFNVVVAQPVTEEGPRPRYGVLGDFNLNIHSADFVTLPGAVACDSCVGFTSGSGTGVSIGAFYELPFSDRVRLMLRAAYSSSSARLTAVEP